MLKMNYKNYLDKVFGCFLGKALIGNIGAPYEGMKQYIDVEYSEAFFTNMIPNDDLDLQVLWLEVLEKKGRYFTSKDLADVFHDKCPYAPGEYSTFKRNYEKGIYPPYSGEFGTRIFEHGMGSPIRSEVWACVTPNNPILASKFAKMDSCLDHKRGSDSENGEIFFAVMESLAFAKCMPKNDVYEFTLNMIYEAAGYIPLDSKLRKLIDDTVRWYGGNKNFNYTRSMIIRYYGDAEATICYQNIGFIILSLLSGKLDFIQCGMEALKCGFDTDCTCATIGSIIGILLGAEEIAKKYGLTSATYTLGVNTTRRSNSIKDLSEDVAAVGYYFSKEDNKEVEITDYLGKVMDVQPPKDKINFEVDYVGEPSIAFGQEKTAKLKFYNLTEKNLNAKITVKSLSGLKLSFDKIEGRISANDSICYELSVKANEDMKYLPAVNKIDVEVSIDDEIYKFDYGYSGDVQWQIRGPFWKNIVEVPLIKAGETSYWDLVGKADLKKEFSNMCAIDKIRHYHTNCLVDGGDMTPEEVFNKNSRDDARYISNFISQSYSDFVLENYENFVGQANYYLKTIVHNEKERAVGLQIGFTDTCKVWLNGKLVAESYGSNKLTYENLHIDNLKLKAGDNELVVMLSKIGEVTRFSHDFMTESAMSNVITDISTKNQKY